MSPRQWLALFCFYITYLLFGASIFYHIERDIEVKNYAIELQRRIDVNEILTKYTDPKYQNDVLKMVGDYCGKPVSNYTDDPIQTKLTWNFYHAFFFAFTVCSTVGYGNISPSSTLGRMIMIMYALVGIPINGFLFAYLGDFFGKVFISAYERYKQYKMSTNKQYMPNQLGLIAQIVLYLVPGIVIFLFLPSLIFSYFENWPYSVSIYYSFVTLSTIGFGDFVPTFQPNQAEQFGFMFYVYEVFIIFWFIFGLGYLVMIMGFIAKGLRSKHLTRLEKQLTDNIKSTQSRIWNGVTKDVSYLRRILNEVYIMKFRGNYGDEAAPERRTSSCPDLSIYRPNLEPARKRAQSLFSSSPENDPDFAQIHRVHSESDLTNVNRMQSLNETGGAMNDPTELLTRVFTALGNIKAADDEAQSIAAMSCGAYNGFSDAQILSSEKTNNSNWSIQYTDNSLTLPPPPRARARAASDVRAPTPEHLEFDGSHEWTWSGSNPQIDEFMRLRRLNKRKAPNLYRTALTTPKSISSCAVNIDEPNMSSLTVEATPRTERSPSIFDRLNPFKRRGDAQSRKQSLAHSDALQNYLEQTVAGRGSCINPTMKRRPSTHSVFSTNDDSSSNILENTTIADLIRALEVMHTQAVAGDDPMLENLLTLPAIPKSRSHTVSESMSSAEQHQQQQQHTLPAINILPTSPTDRRASMRPFSTANTPLFNRANRSRRLSTNIDLSAIRRASLLTPPSSNGPPPYSENTPRTTHRRFSVRPTLLSIPPGQSPMPSIQAVSSLQKRISTRPSPLSLTDYGTSNTRVGRFESTTIAMPISNSQTHLTPLNQSRPSIVQNSRPSIQVYSPNLNLARKSSDSN